MTIHTNNKHIMTAPYIRNQISNFNHDIVETNNSTDNDQHKYWDNLICMLNRPRHFNTFLFFLI